MKLNVLFPIVVFFVIADLSGQDCSNYHPLVKDYSFEIEHYGRKKKLMGKAVHKVQSVESTSLGTRANIEMVMFTPKGEAGTPIHYTVECNEGQIRIDTRAAISGPPDPKFEDEGSCYTDLPSLLDVGQVFSDCKFSSKGKTSFTEVSIYNRKVTGKEQITVPAGMFDAFIIEYDMTMVIKSPGIKVTLEKHHRDWYVPGKGFVRTESFKPNTKYEPGDEPLFSSELIAIR